MEHNPKPLIEISCEDCATVFLAKSKRKRRCPECELLRRKETHKAWMESTKSNNTPRTKKAPRRRFGDNKDVHPILRELNRYNREHGTHLSYGQYVLLMKL